jgi:hypothetical protein
MLAEGGLSPHLILGEEAPVVTPAGLVVVASDHLAAGPP